MSIKYAILGYLSWRSLSGYDLKKLIADSVAFHWTGNNSQIYTTLVELHREGLVTQETQLQEHYPARKIYTITANGLADLGSWLSTTPELPQLRNFFLTQLAWADCLGAGELDDLLAKYEVEVHMQLLMFQEQERRGGVRPARTPREVYLWQMLSANRIGFYENELTWVRRVRAELASGTAEPDPAA
jgi:PadR family transcriptional regulator, regulatory protein AphA